MARYRNKFHKAFNSDFGPEFYETEVHPTAYKGFKIYHRHRGAFDCVIDGINGPECVGQYAGLNGAKLFIDQFWERENAE